MNGNTDFDRLAQSWLQDGPTELPDRSLQAALDEVHVTSQWRFGAARRTFTMNGNTPRLAAAAVIGLLILTGGAIYVGNNSGSGGVGGQPPAATPTPTPTAEASAAVTPAPRVNSADTTGWVPFVSDRYGYEISHPPGAELHPASRDWSLDLAATSPQETASDRFLVGNEGDVVAVAGLAADVPAGMTPDEWIAAAHLGPNPDNPCRASETWETLMVDGHEARFNRQPAADEGSGCEVTIAYVFIDDRVYVFAEWYGRYPELLKGFLSTVRFTDLGPSSTPATPSP